MKKIFFLLTLIFSILSVSAQQETIGINYQAIARNSKGEALPNATLGVIFSVLKGNVNGEMEWQEQHSVQTNEFGLFTLTIGNGSKLAGTATSVNEIPWGNASHFLKVEVNFDGNYITMGTTQLLAVPYALYALKSGSSTGGNQQLSLNTTSKTLDLSNNGGSVKVSDLTSMMLIDKDSTNELQSLTFNKDTKILNLSRNGGQIDLSSFSDGDADPTNELQTLSLADNVLSISKGNSLTLQQPSLLLEKSQLSLMVGSKTMGSYVIDSDSTNEIQDLSLTANTLKITKNKAATSIDLSRYLDNTDNQNLSLNESSKTLSIERGNTLDVTNLINVPWVGFSCSYSSFGTLNMAANSEFSIPWTKDFDDTNNFSNNIFVVPSTGVYSFSITLLFSNSSDNLDLNIYNSGNKLKCYQELGTKSFSTSVMLKLNAGDKIEIKVANRSISSAYNVNQASFIGNRIH